MRSLKLTLLACLIVALFASALTRSFAQETEILDSEIAVAEAVAEPEAESVAEAQPKTSVRPLTVAAGLVDDTMITGTLLDSTSLSIRTAFGEATIPLGEVAGIRFPVGEDTSTTVVMLNGDSITGATEMKFVTVETTWGSAKINGQSVATMLFVPGLKWTSVTGLGGKRWNLVESTASVVEPSTPPSNVQRASATSPTISGPSINSPVSPRVPQGAQPINRFPFRP